MLFKPRKKLFLLVILTVFIVNTGFSCKLFKSGPAELYEPITLEYWGVWDTPEQLSALIADYQTSHPTIKVNYKNFRYEEYERKLLEAWADDRGPDIFAIPSTWLKNYQHRIVPMPNTYQIPVYELQGSIKEELVTVIKTFKGLSAQDIKNQYVSVVYDDVVMEDKVYGLPYYLDTLVTFYNIDLLTKAGIPEPMDDFFDLVEQASRLTKATDSNKIIQSAVALGGTHNIPRFFDVFSSIMLQNGVIADGKQFDPLADRESATRLSQAFNFYTDFARPGKASYSWNADLDDALEVFASGRLAYLFGYSYHADQLRARNLQFDWDIKNFPQTRGAQGSKYYADYWVNVVAKKSKNTDAAWNFIQSTAAADKVSIYLKANKRPTALRALIDEQLNDYEIAPFASQVLTATNWYNGYNITLAEQYTAEIIDDLVSGKLIMDQEATPINLFINKINQTYVPPNN
ncbi:MAG: extracellular solute-binding protein [Patescibacteria group bacterium]|jgi:ABC-type glycerol-3-phosphate transport system substrate-binding protein